MSRAIELVSERDCGGADVRLCVTVPLANEEATVAEFIARVLAQLSPSDRLICVIDNASTDQTLGRARDIAQTDPRVIIVWAPENTCVVDAYFRGYRAALEMTDCRWILEMDGGLSHQPEQIPQFIEMIDRGYDYVGGSRFLRRGSYRGRLSRRLVSWGGGVLANLVLGTRMTDMTSGFECFSRRAMERVVATGVQSKAHFFQTEIKFMLRDWNWIEVPITYDSPSNRLGSASIKEALRNLLALRREARHLPKPAVAV